MSDKIGPIDPEGDFHLGIDRDLLSPEELTFLDDVELIAEETASMTDDETVAFLKEHNLEHIHAALVSTLDPQRTARLKLIWDRDKNKPGN